MRREKWILGNMINLMFLTLEFQKIFNGMLNLTNKIIKNKNVFNFIT